ncbi:MAG: fenitrothion hydrolase, partial [Solirubrobacterales bacterium]|nr:fenitrothion hydrolase [Solirubrobacterales bacterium]
LGRLGALDWRGRELWVRPVLSGAAGITAVPGTVAVMIALIGTTSFDGFSQGPTWNSLAPDLQQLLVDIGISQETALQIAFTIGMAVVLAAVAGLYRIGTVGMRSIDGRHSAGELGARFAHSLLPIALAYVVAHYFSYLAVQGQAISYLASDPLGDGANIFGTATASIDYGLITANTVWYVQVGALIVGHVSGLVLAHDRALTIYASARDAARSQYWMLTVMVAFTCLGLWLLSAGAV